MQGLGAFSKVVHPVVLSETCADLVRREDALAADRLNPHLLVSSEASNGRARSLRTLVTRGGDRIPCEDDVWTQVMIPVFLECCSYMHASKWRDHYHQLLPSPILHLSIFIPPLSFVLHLIIASYSLPFAIVTSHFTLLLLSSSRTRFWRVAMWVALTQIAMAQAVCGRRLGLLLCPHLVSECECLRVGVSGLECVCVGVCESGLEGM